MLHLERAGREPLPLFSQFENWHHNTMLALDPVENSRSAFIISKVSYLAHEQICLVDIRKLGQEV